MRNKGGIWANLSNRFRLKWVYICYKPAGSITGKVNIRRRQRWEGERGREKGEETAEGDEEGGALLVGLFPDAVYAE